MTLRRQHTWECFFSLSISAIPFTFPQLLHHRCHTHSDRHPSIFSLLFKHYFFFIPSLTHFLSLSLSPFFFSLASLYSTSHSTHLPPSRSFIGFSTPLFFTHTLSPLLFYTFIIHIIILLLLLSSLPLLRSCSLPSCRWGGEIFRRSRERASVPASAGSLEDEEEGAIKPECLGQPR